MYTSLLELITKIYYTSAVKPTAKLPAGSYTYNNMTLILNTYPRLVPFLGAAEELHLIDEFKIPRDKYKLIGAVHNSHVGHFGVEKILSTLTLINPRTGVQRNIPWPYMREHVKRFIKRCPICLLYTSPSPRD